MRRITKTLIPLVLLAISGTIAKAETEPGPSVVTSIRPVHALASAVMEGVSSPHLIVQGAGSPHSYTLRPSDAKA
ncbi:MAG: zinc ABC transporter substrate-binding protein, partial [Rhizobiales bacterium]|nr:zinc ABC transporter substrate-binding protein [Hyphomicrobiales bacterium]